MFGKEQAKMVATILTVASNPLQQCFLVDDAHDITCPQGDDAHFVHFVNMFNPDAANPSTAGPYFPQVKSHGLFDTHSWSRNLRPPNDRHLKSTPTASSHSAS